MTNIHIVSKDTKKRIKATPISKVRTKIEGNNAFQPIQEALQLSAFDFNVSNAKPFLVVEGIYDKYAIELMIKPKQYHILPSTSANSIIKNIQFLIGFNKTYVALWDNDDEGRKSYKEACKLFGEIESRKYDLLPLLNKNKRRMEEMFSDKDYETMKAKLNLDDKATYERIISTFYYADKESKQSILKSLEDETIRNFQILNSIIEKRFVEAKNIKSEL